MFCTLGRNVASRRRGTVVVMVAVFMVALLGFAAITVDVGAMYNARNDLQRSADSAALAAAARLSDFELGDPLELAKAAAVEYVASNGVLGRSVTVDPSADVEFLRVTFNAAANSYSFTPTNNLPDAVRVRVRLTEDSPNGALGLFFAPVLGHNFSNVSADAIGMMVPRDIVIAADLSASHTDDSELRHYNVTNINIWDVWNALPGGIDDAGSLWNPAAIPPGWVNPDGSVPMAAGPAWGYMKQLGWGTQTINAAYDPTTDAGLISLPYKAKWTNAQLSTYLTAQGYSATEVSAIVNTTTPDGSGAYPYRVAVALGLANWNSGIPGGRWQAVGAPAGNNNTTISSSELTWTEPIMGRSVADSSTIWVDYINNYVRDTNTYMYEANANFRYRYGVKTFVNYLLEDRPQNDQTPELKNTPTQPMQAVKDAIDHMMDVMIGLNTDDQVALVAYGSTVHLEIPLTTDFQSVTDRINDMQAAHYDRNTNMGGGIQSAVAELTGPRARGHTRKVIILLTDGVANVAADGSLSYVNGPIYAYTQATAAAAQHIRVFAVSVGAEPDLAAMDQIAQVGNGKHYHAEGSIEQYSDQLDSILNILGGKRPIQLAQ